MVYHEPVLAKESVDGMAIRSEGIYVDATFGGGGHSALILGSLGDKGRLIAFDQDADAQANIPEDERLTFVPQNFRHLRRYLRLYGLEKVDGILADLGVSSHQFDLAERGFSFRFDADLDMRMNQREGPTAADILGAYSAADLQRLFSRYGEVRNAKTLASSIVVFRQTKPLKKIADLLQVVDPLVRGQRNRYLAQVFQALRMEVNQEWEALAEFLQQAGESLKEGGRLVIITYHSIEDRMVKNYLKSGNSEGKRVQDFYGNIYRPFRLITRKPVEPSAAEIERNPRSRSAKLRIAEKIKPAFEP